MFLNNSPLLNKLLSREEAPCFLYLYLPYMKYKVLSGLALLESSSAFSHFPLCTVHSRSTLVLSTVQAAGNPRVSALAVSLAWKPLCSPELLQITLWI